MIAFMRNDSVFWIFTIVSLGALITGLVVNGGRKYVRTNLTDCEYEWANIFDGQTGVVRCCSNEISLPSLCSASTTQSFYRYMANLWGAILIPLCGFFIHLGMQLQRSNFYIRDCYTIKLIRRFVLYVIIILFRMYVLYVGLQTIQSSFNSLWSSKSQCWYAQFTRKGTCKDEFDFSDHVVLYMSQFLAIQMFETYALIHENCLPIERWICLSVAALVSIASLIAIHNTVAFFHTRLESITGFCISCLGSYLPLWYIMTGRLKEKAEWLSPEYFTISRNMYDEGDNAHHCL